MALGLPFPCLSRLLYQPPLIFRPISTCSNPISSLSSKNLSFFHCSSCSSTNSFQTSRATSSGGEGLMTDDSGSSLLNEELLRRVSSAKDADQVLDIVAEANSNVRSGVISASDCFSIIAAALERKNVELALLVFSAMRSVFAAGIREEDSAVGLWTWARPDVQTYALLVRGLAACLRVPDAIKIIKYVTNVGVPSEEEVLFGKIVRCPTCIVAIAVAQPQHGIQVVSCSKCRYQYELVSGDIVSIVSEEISTDFSVWRKALRFFQIIKGDAPAALHSIVVRTPSGIARTHKFATKTVELPAQEGERVTISSAAPSYVYQEIGPLRVSAKAPGFSPGEPMCLTNHTTGQVSPLLRAPDKDGNSFLLNPSQFFSLLLLLLATGDAASGIIDPSLPRLISIAAVASVAVGTTIDNYLLINLVQLPQRSVEVVALKQQLLSQYDSLQSRIKDLQEAAEKEVWMLARMCQLENKILAVGEVSYSARRARVKRVRESLENSLLSRIELIESYAKISSMIEIELEMDSDVPVAEAVRNAKSIVEQIEQITEIENLKEGWRIQAEANDEVERLLSSQPGMTEQEETHGHASVSKHL
ncbi:uncharacterized protein LOC120254065 [Dioscorea cayenensis subsp. rotundata]|uniref:Uncharacterized protein LOC120254065 n=1 Tax=Dioscorea cayennensis subsp. rotundata TaxID=55577 RepID=A0AB40AT34_DIOCR|nr:uncharacterized protein LOC120254065 [Dioscorea cayenensis subsp. rotundata]